MSDELRNLGFKHWFDGWHHQRHPVSLYRDHSRARPWSACINGLDMVSPPGNLVKFATAEAAGRAALDRIKQREKAIAQARNGVSRPTATPDVRLREKAR